MRSYNYLLITLLCLCGAGCTVLPGTYMRVNDVRKPATINNKTFYPKVESVADGLIANQSKHYQYIIGPYDVLNIIVWEHPELTVPENTILDPNADLDLTELPQGDPQRSGTLVDAHGYIYFPYAGRIKVTGKTPGQVQAILTQKLAKYIQAPKVSVRVAVFRSQRINIIGEVMKPGTQYLTNRPLTILDAINAAGGISKISADTRHIYVFRKGHPVPIIYWLNAKSPQNLLLAEQFRLVDDDIVYVTIAPVSSFDRVVSEILPTVQTIWYTQDLMG
ncbi:MAG: polysaccharide biosynthesis/export family protein [Gammaproteobacteria bacterium]|nr:polysaccharide biosynthesis/export family protein [Gammaproteobacteria bacterium]